MIVPEGFTTDDVATNLRALLVNLRSKKFQQGRRWLCIARVSADLTPTCQHCCLGVAGETAIELGYDVLVDSTRTTGCRSFGKRNGKIPDAALLPDDVADLFGLDNGLQRVLSDMNDDDERTFEEIADYIEEKILPQYVNPVL